MSRRKQNLMCPIDTEECNPAKGHIRFPLFTRLGQCILSGGIQANLYRPLAAGEVLTGNQCWSAGLGGWAGLKGAKGAVVNI